LPDEQFLQSKTQATASLRQSPPIALRSIKFVAETNEGLAVSIRLLGR